MPRQLKVFGGMVHITIVERDALGLRPHITQAQGVIETTSRTAAGKALRLTRDFIGETGNARDIELAREHSGKVVLRNRGGGGPVREGSPDFIVREPRS